ncbi:MAG: 3'-5' exonuclease [Anaeromyxobacter sp.]
MRRFLTLDLETVPDEALVSAVDGNPSLPYPEKLRNVLAERRARTGGRSDFLPLPYHRPIAACVLEAVEDGGLIRVVDVADWSERREPEPEFLEAFWSRLDGASLVSFHGKGFDLPVLELRSLKHGVPAPPWVSPARRGSGPGHFDLKELLAGPSGAAAAPLDLYAKLVGLPGKEDVAGEDVLALHASGDLDRIVAYCMSDVVQTFLLFLRWRLVEGSLTPDGYAESAEQARQALPALFQRRLAPGPRAALEGFLDRCGPYFGIDRALLKQAL